MSIVDGNWKTFMARATVLSAMLGVVVFGAVKLAVADPGGPTSPQLTFAGVLRDPSGELPRAARSATLTFTFTKPGAAPCSVDVRDVPIAAGGAFTAGVSIASCPTYFDGSNVTYTVAEGGAMLTPDGGVAITPVPYARFADQAGVNNDCPAGFQRAIDPAFTDPMRLCQRKRGDGSVFDEVVRVGMGASALWIDRYEASVWYVPDGSTRNYGIDRDDYSDDGDFPDNGQWATRPKYALSRAAVSPSRFITWFQASEACAASGKRLPTGDEWLRAVRGTPDPSSGELGDGREGRCLTNVSGVRVTGGRGRALGIIGCESAWGAQDMIGNLWEWTTDWQSGVVPGIDGYASGTLYGGDSIYNITSTRPTDASVSLRATTIPGTVLRGGGYGDGTVAGIFAMIMSHSPAYSDGNKGFRCVISR